MVPQNMRRLVDLLQSHGDSGGNAFKLGLVAGVGQEASNVDVFNAPGGPGKGQGHQDPEPKARFDHFCG